MSQTFAEYFQKHNIAPPKPRSVAAYRADVRRQGDRPKSFPKNYGFGINLVETVQPDDSVNVWWNGDPNYSQHQIAEYIREFCKLNHLKTGE